MLVRSSPKSGDEKKKRKKKKRCNETVLSTCAGLVHDVTKFKLVKMAARTAVFLQHLNVDLKLLYY